MALAVLAVILACGQTQARTLDQVPPYLKQEGNFVAYPAIAVGGFGMVVGAILALPATIIATPIGWAAGDPLGYTLLPSSVLATGGAEAGYHLGGAIPWALKNGFYDAPMNAVARIKGEPASGLVAQVEPLPPPQSDLQYLETTPVDARVPVVLARRYSSALPPPKPLTSLMLRRQLSPFKPPQPRKPADASLAKAAPAAAMPAAKVSPPPAPAAMPVPSLAPAAAPAAAPVPAPSAPLSAAPAVAPEPVAPALAAPEPVAIAPVMPQPVPQVVEASRVEPPPPAAPEPASASPDADAAAADAEEAQRPALKKKRKFSERFNF